MIDWKNTFGKNKAKYLKILQRRFHLQNKTEGWQNLQKIINTIEEKIFDYKKKLQYFELIRHQIKKHSQKFVETKIKKKNIVNLKIKNKKLKEELETEKTLIDKLMLQIPNFPHNDVPLGNDNNENKIVYTSKHQKKTKTLHHWEIGTKLDYFENKIATQISKARFLIYKRNGAKLIRALTKMMLDTHHQNHYHELLLPQIVNKKAMQGTGQLPKMKDDCFQLKWNETKENDYKNFYLLPTSEVGLVNYFQNKTFKNNELPQKVCAYSLCFRKEAGAAGKDTRGLIRLHQFHKVELVKITTQETSYQELEKMCHDSEKILEILQIPYRKILLCSGDLGFSSTKTYDLEIWMPHQQKYVEVASISNTESFQAKYLNIKYHDEKEKKFVHTLNGSALAIDRLIACLLETYYNVEKNKIFLPQILEKYLL